MAFMPTMIQILDFEDTWTGRAGGAKHEAIRDTLNIPPATYYLLLGRIIDTIEAEQARPQLVHRLRRVRETRRAERARRVA